VAPPSDSCGSKIVEKIKIVQLFKMEAFLPLLYPFDFFTLFSEMSRPCRVPVASLSLPVAAMSHVTPFAGMPIASPVASLTVVPSSCAFDCRFLCPLAVFPVLHAALWRLEAPCLSM